MQASEWMRIAALSVVLVGGRISAPSALAQETPAEAAEGAPAEAAAASETPAAGETPAAPPQQEPNAVVTEGHFAPLFDQWKQSLANLRAIQLEYKVAKPADRPGLRNKYDEELAKAQELVEPLKAAAEAAYATDPEANPQAGDLLAQFLRSDVQKTDAYEEALRFGKILIEHGYSKNEIWSLTGVAAYAVMDLDLAEKYLTTAKEKGAIDQLGLQYLAEIPTYRPLWEQEQKLRAAETQADDLPRVKLVTSQGEMVIELFENEAPNTVANFISLVEKKFYDGLTFHRVLPGFMAQGGDPKGDGTGGPGYYIECECDNENHRDHFRGTLSMAHAGRDTGGSQFFLTFVPTSHLNGQHTVFGRVIEGVDVLSRLRRINPEAVGGQKDKIITATVLRKRDHAYEPKTLPGR